MPNPTASGDLLQSLQPVIAAPPRDGCVCYALPFASSSDHCLMSCTFETRKPSLLQVAFCSSQFAKRTNLGDATCLRLGPALEVCWLPFAIGPGALQQGRKNSPASDAEAVTPARSLARGDAQIRGVSTMQMPQEHLKPKHILAIRLGESKHFEHIHEIPTWPLAHEALKHHPMCRARRLQGNT